jgi:hypothetical protein
METKGTRDRRETRLTRHEHMLARGGDAALSHLSLRRDVVVVIMCLSAALEPNSHCLIGDTSQTYL